MLNEKTLIIKTIPLFFIGVEPDEFVSTLIDFIKQQKNHFEDSEFLKSFFDHLCQTSFSIQSEFIEEILQDQDIDALKEERVLLPLSSSNVSKILSNEGVFN